MKIHIIANSIFFLTVIIILNMRLKEAEARIQSLAGPKCNP